MIFEVLMFLFLLNLKHLVVDFYMQTDEMVRCKGSYGDLDGMEHSFQHSIATFIVVLVFAAFTGFLNGVGFPMIVWYLFGIAWVDFLSHYHIDYVKMQMERDVRKKEFWRALGCDQFLHQATYIGLAMILFWSML